MLCISRISVYYTPRPVSVGDLTLMWRIDELHLEYPFAGSRLLQGFLAGERSKAGRLHVSTLMTHKGLRRFTVVRTRQNQPMATKSVLIFCAIWRLPGPIRFGRRTSHTFRWRRGLSISSPSSTGSAGAYSPGGFQSPWMRIFAYANVYHERQALMTRLRKPWQNMAVQRSSTRTRGRSSRRQRSRRCFLMLALRSAWTAKAPGRIFCERLSRCLSDRDQTSVAHDRPYVHAQRLRRLALNAKAFEGCPEGSGPILNARRTSRGQLYRSFHWH